MNIFARELLDAKQENADLRTMLSVVLLASDTLNDVAKALVLRNDELQAEISRQTERAGRLARVVTMVLDGTNMTEQEFCAKYGMIDIRKTLQAALDG